MPLQDGMQLSLKHSPLWTGDGPNAYWEAQDRINVNKNSSNLPNDRPGMITRLIKGEYVTLYGEHAESYLRRDSEAANTGASYPFRDSTQTSLYC